MQISVIRIKRSHREEEEQSPNMDEVNIAASSYSLSRETRVFFQNHQLGVEAVEKEPDQIWSYFGDKRVSLYTQHLRPASVSQVVGLKKEFAS